MHTGLEFLIFMFFCVNATLAGNFTLRFKLENHPRISFNYLVYCILVSSIIWSLGMGLMQVQTDDHYAYICRVIGIFGTFMFMMSVQKTMCTISGIDSRIQTFLNGISYSGLIVYFLYIQPGQTIFVHNIIGTSFYFKPGIVNVIYTAYYVIVSTNIFAVTIYMTRKHPLKQVRTAGRHFIIVCLMIFTGAISDLILPAFGHVAFPGSALTHFWGVCVFWLAIHEMFQSMVTVSSMSEYIYSSLNSPILVLNADHTIEIVNDASLSYFQINNETFVPGSLFISNILSSDDDFFSFEGQNGHINAKCIASGNPCEVCINRIINKYNDTIGYIVLINDLTEHQMAIQQMNQAKLAAESANLSKSLFLANMSHEIRTPMNAILGFSQLALSEKIDDVSREYFTEIYQSGELLLSVINEILDFSKIELGKQELKCENYELSKVLNDVGIIIDVQAKKKGLNFVTEIQTDIPPLLFGDKNKIREILINILNNSVKYTEHGNIKLSVKFESDTPTVGKITFTITDTGIGIKDEDLPSIFDKFKRLDENINSSTEGTGLGLSITKGLVTLMGGSISVKSKEGVGSIFTVTIPQSLAEPYTVPSNTEINNQDDSETVTSESASTILKGPDLKVLTVDDNKVNLKVTSLFLKSHGINTDFANSGIEAIQKCKDELYDIVFMDQMMPEMDGVEAMKHIREIPGYEYGSSHKIIVLTANAIAGVANELISEGFDAYLEKPIKIDTFIKTMNSVLPSEKLENIRS